MLGEILKNFLGPFWTKTIDRQVKSVLPSDAHYWKENNSKRKNADCCELTDSDPYVCEIEKLCKYPLYGQ